MTDEWQNTTEEDGITLGPEEALEREIAKSKALKVERLQLRDQVEQLTLQNRSLHDQLEVLKHKSEGSHNTPEHSSHATNNTRYPEAQKSTNDFLPNRWAFILLVFNLAAIGFLLVYLLRHPTP